METDSTETILNLLQLRQSYQQKLREIACSLEAASEVTSQNDDEKEEEIELRIEMLQDELLINSTRFALKERMLKYLQFSNTLCNITAHALDDEENPFVVLKQQTEESIVKKLELLGEISQKIMKSTNEMEELNVRLDAKRYKSLSLIIKARCLTSELKKLEERERENQQKSETIIKLEKKLEGMRHINCIIRKVFLDLIHSTEIDWYEDETIRKTVLLLGEKMQTS